MFQLGLDIFILYAILSVSVVAGYVFIAFFAVWWGPCRQYPVDELEDKRLTKLYTKFNKTFKAKGLRKKER